MGGVYAKQAGCSLGVIQAEYYLLDAVIFPPPLWGRAGWGVSMNHEFARNLRRNMTDAERVLWSRIRNGQIYGARFRRQCPIGRFIVDFVWLAGKVVVELDGGQHADKQEADQSRTAWLAAEGFEVMRFWNHEVLQDLDSVVQVVGNRIKEVGNAVDCRRGF